jgi:alpha-tubulin suppressor-like RCC1 family protein
MVYLPARVTVPNLDGEIALGGGTSCVRKDDGTVWCWGAGMLLGDGQTHESFSVVKVMSDTLELSAGMDGTRCARKRDGSVWCWSENAFGEAGDGSTERRVVPVRVEVAPSIHVFAGFHTACSIDATNTLWCWGANTHGEIGDGTMAGEPCWSKDVCRPSPTRVAFCD